MYRLSQYSFFRVLSKWFDLLLETTKQWQIFLAYAFCMTFLSAIFGRWTYACQQDTAAAWCYTPSQNIYMSITWIVIFYLLLFYLVGSFVYDMGNSIAVNSVFKWKNIWKADRRKAKIVLAVCSIIVSFVASIAMAVYIIRRPANPDFRIEFIFFLITFAFILVPMFMIRCSACFAYYLNTGSFATAKVYDETGGKSYISVAMFLLLMIFTLVLNMRSITYLRGLMLEYNNFGTALLTDFLGNLLVLICVAVFLVLFQAQYIQMEKDITQTAAETLVDEAGKNGTPEETTAAETTPARAKRSVKSANKKKNKRKTKEKEK